MGTLFTPGIEQNEYKNIQNINLRVNNRFICSIPCPEKITIFDVNKVVFHKNNKNDVNLFCII
jgi:hypothetical protein